MLPGKANWTTWGNGLGVLRIKKVVAYITRQVEGRQQLLVFTHRDEPEAGLQVPAGTVEEGETIEAALFREIAEETGLTDIYLVCPLTVYDWTHPETGNVHERHVFHLTAPTNTHDTWDWIETSGGQVSELEGYVFQYAWCDLAEKIDLAGGQGDYLSEVRRET